MYKEVRTNIFKKKLKVLKNNPIIIMGRKYSVLRESQSDTLVFTISEKTYEIFAS